MNAWVFRHIDELQRIYAGPRVGSAEPHARSAPAAPSPDVAHTPRRAPAPDLGDPFSGRGSEALSDPVPIQPGSVLRELTDDGPDVLLMPFRAQNARHRRRRLS